jgi:aspartate carbamoyltransferase catalytic subunit
MGTIQLAKDLPRHILDIRSLGKSGIEQIISANEPDISEKGDNVALLFFESSTRTRLSFELAALNLNCRIISPNLETSSIQKGETALDTVTTVAAMGVDQIILRSHENGFSARAAAALGDSCRIINAGDGTNQHPSQALTDLYILKKHCPVAWPDLKVGIVGNISHSRVANSLIDGLSLVGAQSLHLIGPESWLPRKKPDFARCFDQLEEGLRGLHAIIVLRPQWERIQNITHDQIMSLQADFQLQNKHLQLMAPNAILLHPGPVLWGKEISTELMHNNSVKIKEQVTAGVTIRKTLLGINRPK